MATEALVMPGSGREKRTEYKAIALVSSAHFVNHFQHLVLPPLFPLLKAQFGIGFVELGLALTVASVVGVAAQLPVGYLVDRVGSRRMLALGLLLAVAGDGVCRSCQQRLSPGRLRRPLEQDCAGSPWPRVFDPYLRRISRQR